MVPMTFPCRFRGYRFPSGLGVEDFFGHPLKRFWKFAIWGHVGVIFSHFAYISGEFIFLSRFSDIFEKNCHLNILVNFRVNLFLHVFENNFVIICIRVNFFLYFRSFWKFALFENFHFFKICILGVNLNIRYQNLHYGTQLDHFWCHFGEFSVDIFILF